MIAAVGALVTAFVVAGYLSGLAEGGQVEHGRAMALAVLTTASATLTAVLSRLGTWTSRAVAGGTLALSAVLIQTPMLARLLHLAPLHGDDWAQAFLAGILACSPALLMTRTRPYASEK